MELDRLKEIDIREINNGYVVSVKNSIHFDGDKCFYSVDELKILEHIGKIIFNDKYWRLPNV